MKIFNYPAITSTNDYAREHLDEFDKVIVTAAHQWLGRGRNHHHWEGDYAKNVYLSYGIRHELTIGIEDASVYQAFGCLAAKKTLNSFIDKDLFKIKYPNDIVVPDGDSYKKIGGVIIEHIFYGSSCYSTIVGIGLNIMQEQFTQDVNVPATSMKLLGFKVRVGDAIDTLIAQIQQYSEKSLHDIKNEWINELNLEGKKLSIVGKDGQWVFDGFEPDLRLKVKGVFSGEPLIISNGDSIRYKL